MSLLKLGTIYDVNGYKIKLIGISFKRFAHSRRSVTEYQFRNRKGKSYTTHDRNIIKEVDNYERS